MASHTSVMMCFSVAVGVNRYRDYFVRWCNFSVDEGIDRYTLTTDSEQKHPSLAERVAE